MTPVQQRRGALNYPIYQFAVAPQRRALLHGIAQRFDQMLAEGFQQEVEALFGVTTHPDCPAIRSVGYRQMWHYLTGELTYQAMKERGLLDTTACKAQLTWLRGWQMCTGWILSPMINSIRFDRGCNSQPKFSVKD